MPQIGGGFWGECWTPDWKGRGRRADVRGERADSAGPGRPLPRSPPPAHLSGPAVWAAGSFGKCLRPGSRKLLGRRPPARTRPPTAQARGPDPRGRSRHSASLCLARHLPGNPYTRAPQDLSKALSRGLYCVRAREQGENSSKEAHALPSFGRWGK